MSEYWVGVKYGNISYPFIGPSVISFILIYTWSPEQGVAEIGKFKGIIVSEESFTMTLDPWYELD